MRAPNSLLISGDGYLEHFRHDAEATVDPDTKIVRVPVQVNTPLSGGAHDLLRYLKLGDLSPEILSTLDWTNRSVCSRLGIEIEDAQFESSIVIDDIHMMEATAVFYPGEDVDGAPEQSPLPLFINRWIKNARVHMGRLFAIPEGVKPLTEQQVKSEIAGHQLKTHTNSVVMPDGEILLPFVDLQYYIMHGLMPQDVLHNALVGSGRGSIEALQPVIKGEIRDIPPHSMRVTATEFSLLRHMGILSKEIYQLMSRKVVPGLEHGTSRGWDGGKTAGKYPRQLEVKNRTNTAVSQAGLAAGIRLYPAAPSTRLLKTVVRGSPARTVEEGVTIDQYIATGNNQAVFRELHAFAERRPEDWGMLVTGSGVRMLRQYKHDAHQERALVAGVNTLMQDNAKPDELQIATDLQSCLRALTDPRQRSVLFCREMPSPGAISQIMSKGVRTIVTSNISRTASKLYVSAGQVTQYKELAEQGLELFVITPDVIRKLYRDMFVKLESLDKIKKTDTRLGGYAASMDGIDAMMEQGHFPEFLQRMQRDFPNLAMVNGASKSGGMKYMNAIAQQLGIPTIGIANEIPGQEAGDTSLDAITFFIEDGLIARQDLMNRIITFPLVNPGAEGSAFEAFLELMMRKLGRCPMAPAYFADPVGLGKDGAHYWQPIMDLQRQHAGELPEDVFGKDLQGKLRRFSRSPFVKDVCHLETDYRQVHEKYARFRDDPLAYWQCDERHVPKKILSAAQDRVLRDALSTGLPLPDFWKPIIQNDSLSQLKE